MSQIRQFFRSRFSKQGDVRFSSHHDIMRLFERAFRRARLPVAMSQGYNPRPRISVPAPLSVGFKGENEVLDFELCRWLEAEDVEQKLAAELPEGIELQTMKMLSGKPDRRPSCFSYRIPLRDGHPVCEEKLTGLTARDPLMVERRKKNEVKEKDISDSLRELRIQNGQLHMLIAMTERGAARPEEVLRLLGCRPGRDYLKSFVVRTHVDLSSSL
ncbi:MAG: TIGR03936 family radical SAM-associated protein [Candidatus Brocadiia bacterium]